MECAYCLRSFTERGLSRHLSSCKARAEAKTKRGVLILNEDVTTCVLSFLELRDLLLLYPVLGLSVDLLCDEFATARKWKRVPGFRWRDFIEQYVLPSICEICSEPKHGGRCLIHNMPPEPLSRSFAKRMCRLGDADLDALPHTTKTRGRRVTRLYELEDLVVAVRNKRGDAYQVGFTEGRRRLRDEQAVAAFEARRAEVRELIKDAPEEFVTIYSNVLALHNMECVRAAACNLVIYAHVRKSLRLNWAMDFVLHVNAHDLWGILHQMELRKCMLERALAARGLSLRDDSRLCWMYIYENELIGRGDPERGTVENIVDMMEECHYLFHHTEYAKNMSLEHISGTPRRRKLMCLTILRRALAGGEVAKPLPALWTRRLAVMKAAQDEGISVCDCVCMVRAVMAQNIDRVRAHARVCTIAPVQLARTERGRRRVCSRRRQVAV